MSKKKRRIIARILAGLLCLAMVLGAIIPYVSASEIDTGESSAQDALNMVSEYLQSTLDSNDINSENENAEKPLETTDNSAEETRALPEGFEYIDGKITKAEGNTNTAIALNTIPSDFDQLVITIFIGNLETHEVQAVDLKYDESYINSVALSDGYYVIFANDYAWSDKNGNTYAINDGEFQYIYIGDEMDAELYGIEFQTVLEEDFFYVELGAANESMSIVEYGATLNIKNSDLKYPEAANLNKLKDDVETGYKPPSEQKVQDEAETQEDIGGNLFGIIGRFAKDVFSGSYILIIAIVVCWVILSIIKSKKNKNLEGQAENDRLDDQSIE